MTSLHKIFLRYLKRKIEFKIVFSTISRHQSNKSANKSPFKLCSLFPDHCTLTVNKSYSFQLSCMFCCQKFFFQIQLSICCGLFCVFSFYCGLFPICYIMWGGSGAWGWFIIHGHKNMKWLYGTFKMYELGKIYRTVSNKILKYVIIITTRLV